MKHRTVHVALAAVAGGLTAGAGRAWGQAVPPAGDAAGAGGGGIVTAIILVAALLVIIGAAVKFLDLKRRRESEAVHLQAQISDALLRDPALFGLPVTPTVRVPTWRGSPATIEISGQVPTPEARAAVLEIARNEASRIRTDFTIEERLAVVPTMAAAA